MLTANYSLRIMVREQSTEAENLGRLRAQSEVRAAVAEARGDVSTCIRERSLAHEYDEAQYRELIKDRHVLEGLHQCATIDCKCMTFHEFCDDCYDNLTGTPVYLLPRGTRWAVAIAVVCILTAVALHGQGIEWRWPL